MSAPTLALAEVQQRKVIVRLADPAVAAAYISVAFGLLLVFFPVWFPRMMVRNWWNGRLTIAMVVFTLLFDSAIYIRVAPSAFRQARDSCTRMLRIAADYDRGGTELTPAICNFTNAFGIPSEH